MVLNEVSLKSVEFSEQEQQTIANAFKDVFEQYDNDLENKAIGVSPEQIELGKLHVETVYMKTLEFADLAELDSHQKFLVGFAAVMHDAKKFSAERSDSLQRLLFHAHDSELWSAEYMSKIGIDKEDQTIVQNAILRHQPMPYVAHALLDVLVDQKENHEYDALRELIARTAPDLVESGRFLGPNDEVSAVLYSADLLAMGELVSGDEKDVKAGAFDKIVEINLSRGQNLKEACESAYISLVANVAVLEGASKTIDVMREDSSYFQGRVPEILTKIAKKNGQQLLIRAHAFVTEIHSLSETGKITKNQTNEEAMALYYKTAKEITNKFQAEFEN